MICPNCKKKDLTEIIKEKIYNCNNCNKIINIKWKKEVLNNENK